MRPSGGAHLPMAGDVPIVPGYQECQDNGNLLVTAERLINRNPPELIPEE